MIATSSIPNRVRSERFECMLAMFSVGGRGADGDQRSILCRILNGSAMQCAGEADLELLTDDERGHYGRLSDSHAHALHCRARAELRRMLAREIELDPHLIPIIADEHGKPRCPCREAAGLDFSVAHSGECAIVAVGEVRGIGVDVELIPDEPVPWPLLEAGFSSEEQRQWSELPPEARASAFADAWVIKEAALKAAGTGLDGSPQDIRVRFDASGRAWPVLPHEGWLFERLHVSPSYAAWLAVML